MATQRVVLADDHALFRHGMRSLIESSGLEYVVVGEASDGLEAVSMVMHLRPELLLMDLCMPNQNGMGLIAAIPSTSETSVYV